MSAVATSGHATMTDLLDSVTRSNAETDKAANETVVSPGAPNPPTSGPGGGEAEDEASFSEGERSAENTERNRESLGETGPEGAPSADANTGDYNQHMRAAPLKPTGEDPEAESNSIDPPSNVEPGSSHPATLTGKMSAWEDKAGDLMIDLITEHKLAAAGGVPEFVQRKMSGDQPDASPSQAYEPQVGGNVYMELTAGDEKLAQEYRQLVHTELAAAHAQGSKMALDTVAYFESLSDQERATAQKQAATSRRVRHGGQLLRKAAMGEMPPEAMGGEMPPEAMGGMPPEAMGGEMPPEAMGGEMPPEAMGGGGDEEAALMELANELGISPEELIGLLEAEMAGGGGGAPPEGMPPEAGPPEAGPPAEAPPEAPPEEVVSEDKAAAVRMLKSAVDRAKAKEKAASILLEKISRGRR